MKTCGALLALLCCCLTEMLLRGETISQNNTANEGHYGEAADTASTKQICQPDVHTLLREMSIVVAEQKVELRYAKTYDNGGLGDQTEKQWE